MWAKRCRILRLASSDFCEHRCVAVEAVLAAAGGGLGIALGMSLCQRFSPCGLLMETSPCRRASLPPVSPPSCWHFKSWRVRWRIAILVWRRFPLAAT
mmetsp:Transcript_114708/g.309838  ORF Transcript_114708/g.309838 Transcript_114708/m.309838 type:complete len:98 (-) Transcript_114708:110-403(-)